jgi:ABC-type phosphate/phosphonate transport system substrate-binding protein
VNQRTRGLEAVRFLRCHPVFAMLRFSSTIAALVIVAIGATVAPALRAATPAKCTQPLRVALVSGAETYNSGQALTALAIYFEREHGMECDVLALNGVTLPSDAATNKTR